MNLDDIPKLHRAYCEATGLEVQLTMARHFTWEAWLVRGFSIEDLRLVCRKMRSLVDRGKRLINSISFHKLIGDTEYFEELLAEFRALERKPRFSPGKAAVLRDTGRTDEPKQPDSKSAKDVIWGLKMAKQLREFRKKL